MYPRLQHPRLVGQDAGRPSSAQDAFGPPASHDTPGLTIQVPIQRRYAAIRREVSGSESSSTSRTGSFCGGVRCVGRCDQFVAVVGLADTQDLNLLADGKATARECRVLIERVLESL
jgi:hypothetical protein